MRSAYGDEAANRREATTIGTRRVSIALAILTGAAARSLVVAEERPSSDMNRTHHSVHASR